MDTKNFIAFLKSCDCSSKEINALFKGKKGITKKGNFYIIDKNSNLQNINVSSLYFISLQKKTPSRYCYEWLKKNSSMKRGKLKGEKHLQKILYGKQFPISTIEINSQCSEGDWFLIIFNDEVLGIGEFVGNNKPCEVIYHVGEYLKEQ